jgi:hypothetical protein
MRIVCLTSNGYINCVEPFAHYWNHFAGADRRVTVACYDLLPQGLPDNFDVMSIGRQAEYTWSSGLLKLLEGIDDEIVLLMMEDYFLTQPVNWFLVDFAYGMMRNNALIAKIDLTDDRLKVPVSQENPFSPEVFVSAPESAFTASVQAALWRRDFFEQFILPEENAWEFEKYASRRYYVAWRDRAYPKWILGYPRPPMQYANAVGGAGGKPGVIEPKHMPAWMWQECVEKGWAR